MSLIPIWVKALVVAALLAALSWGVHLYNQGIRDTQQALDQAKYDQALINAQADAKAQTDAWMKTLKEKDDATTKAIQARDTRYAGVVNANGKLRDELANLSSDSAQLTPTACSEGIKTLSAVFGQCLDRYSEMGKRAEGHLLDSEDCRATGTSSPTSSVTPCSLST